MPTLPPTIVQSARFARERALHTDTETVRRAMCLVGYALYGLLVPLMLLRQAVWQGDDWSSAICYWVATGAAAVLCIGNHVRASESMATAVVAVCAVAAGVGLLAFVRSVVAVAHCADAAPFCTATIAGLQSAVCAATAALTAAAAVMGARQLAAHAKHSVDPRAAIAAHEQRERTDRSAAALFASLLMPQAQPMSAMLKKQ